MSRGLDIGPTAIGHSDMPRKARAPETDELGLDKAYFKIGEVAEIVGVEPYVLRYWETEFKALKPQKSKTQQRVYRRNDVALLLKIKQLLHVQRFTIEGARLQLKDPSSCTPARPSPSYRLARSIKQVRARLEDVRRVLQEPIDLERGADPSQALRSSSDPPERS